MNWFKRKKREDGFRITGYPDNRNRAKTLCPGSPDPRNRAPEIYLLPLTSYLCSFHRLPHDPHGRGFERPGYGEPGGGDVYPFTFGAI